MQSSANRFLRRNVPPFRNNRPSSNYGKDRKEQNSANGICNSKMSFAVQRHNRKDRNEKPRSAGKGASQERLNQHVTMGTTLTSDCKRLLTDVLRESIEVQVDYSCLNKVCAKDMYPFSEEGEELASVMEYPYKCFLRLLKENSQIRMAENDEQKTGFHTEEGVYCFTHMPKELKNSVATLQRMMEKVFSDQRGRNVVEEGKFLGHMVTKEGVRADLEKVQTIIRSPTPKRPNQIRSLFLQLTAIGKFIPKLVELKYPINKISMRMDTATQSGWTNEAKEAFQRIKRKLSKLQTLAIPREEEELMLCLRQRNEMVSSVLMVEREGVQTPVSYEAEGLVVKKFFGQGEQVQKTLDANKGEMSNLSKKLQAKLTPTPRAWRLYLGKEAIE
ncbi:hypothetical protein Tco_0556873 [Tanacetum coccineum]